jgi:zinc protease
VSVAALLLAPLAAEATTIQRVVSPGGIEAWLVQEPSVPLIALDFAFRGGANQDPVDKPGAATMAAALLDEGAGEFDPKSFHERLETKAIELSFNANRDQTAGALRMSANQDEASSCCGWRSPRRV